MVNNNGTNGSVRIASVDLRDYFESQISSLRELLNERLDLTRVALEQRMNAGETARLLAAHNIDSRLAGMNEFREALKDQASRLATREEMIDATKDLELRINSLELNRAASEGKAKLLGALWGIGSGVICAVIINLLISFSRIQQMGLPHIQ